MHTTLQEVACIAHTRRKNLEIFYFLLETLFCEIHFTITQNFHFLLLLSIFEMMKGGKYSERECISVTAWER